MQDTVYLSSIINTKMKIIREGKFNMFKETKKWEITLVGAIGLIMLGITLIIKTLQLIDETMINELTFMADSVFFAIGLPCVVLGMVLLAFSRTTIIESTPIDYTLKEKLSISVDRGYKPHMSIGEDTNGLKIVNDGNDKMIDHIVFQEGDIIQIKTIEEYTAFTKNDKRDWRDLRVYIILEDELIELSYEDIKKQGIDELLRTLHNEK